MARNFSKLALALGIFAAVFLKPGDRVATDLVEATAGRVYAPPNCVSASWEQGHNTGGLTVYALASHSDSPNVYAGVWGEGVYRALSGGNSWSQTLLGFPMRISSLAIYPVSPDIVYVYAGTMEYGIQRSVNGGDSWDATTGLSQDVWSLAVASTADSIYAYAGTAGEIYTSTNGIDWNPVGGAEIGTDKFYALAIDPQDSKTAYVGTKGKGVYRMTGGGLNWTSRGLDGKTVRALAIHPSDSEIYAGTESHGIFKSADSEDSWPVGGLDGHKVLAIAINPRNPEFVYAGTYGDGVWVSYNGGHSWHRMSGLTDGASFVYSLTLFTPEEEDDCQVLYAGTLDGVWDRAVASVCAAYLPLIHKGSLTGQ